MDDLDLIAQQDIVAMRARLTQLDDAALDLLFRKARSHNGWSKKPVSDDLLRQLHDLVKMGPTSANCSPQRTIFLRSEAAKQRLVPALSKGNLDKVITAPVVAILGYDTHFYDRLDYLFPHVNAKPWFTSSEKLAMETAFRNATLQGAYFIIAARALGLDTGPMSGFENPKVDAEFFAGTPVQSNFICALGYGDESKVRKHLPRFKFEDVCQIL